jgi:hypothetical protein
MYHLKRSSPPEEIHAIQYVGLTRISVPTTAEAAEQLSFHVFICLTYGETQIAGASLELSTLNVAYSLLEKLYNILTKVDSLYSNHTAENSKSRVTENNHAEIFNSATGVVL